RGENSINLPRQDSLFEEERTTVATGCSERLATPKPVSIRERSQASATPDAERRPPKRLAEEVPVWEPGADEEEALLAAAMDEQAIPKTSNKAQKEGSALNDGMAAALAKLRQG
ncbi:MAG: hypothetical protein Q9204_008148, partial [Flavoplaca sp. TL-2023a]